MGCDRPRVAVHLTFAPPGVAGGSESALRPAAGPAIPVRSFPRT